MSEDASSKEQREPPPAPRSAKLVVACLAGIALLTALDLGSKQWAIDALSTERPGEPPPVCEANARGLIPKQRLQGQPVELAPGYLELTYAENCGAAFGLMRDAPPTARHAVFGIAAVVASVALLWMFVRGRGTALYALSVPFIVSGAVGNFFDRVYYGYVVDFILFMWDGEPAWPTFNVADAWITVGVALMLIDMLREMRREKRAAREKKAAPGSAETEKG